MAYFMKTFSPILSFFAAIFISISILFTPAAPVEAYTAKDEENLLMSFASISDTHIKNNLDTKDYYRSRYLIRSLQEIEAAETKADALVISGDITHNGTAGEHLILTTIFDKYPSPDNIFLAPGNHDFGNTKEGDYNLFKNRFLSSYKKITGIELENVYYSATVKDFYFIVMSSEAMAGTHQVFSQTQLDWLEDTLSEAGARFPGKPIFVINHNPIKGTNNVDRSWPSGGTVGEQNEELMEILQRHENVFFITGHLHEKLNADRVMTVGKVHFINTPCFHDRDDFGTGYVIEAYEDQVVLRARDFLNSKWRDFEYSFDLVKD